MNLSRHNINCQCQSCRSRSRAAAVAQRKPAAKTAVAASKPAESPKAAAEPAPQQKSVKAAAFERSYLSAFVADIICKPSEEGAVIPLQQQRTEGGYTLKRGAVAVPEDGFYMLLWEIGLIHAQGGADLRLGINQTGTVLSQALQPGYDSGQQVTWLCQGDQLSLQLVGAGDQSEIHGNCARLTVLRMG